MGRGRCAVGAGVALMFGDCYHGRRVLVTGHTGFKGSWLVAWLKRLGAQVAGYSLGDVSEPSHWQLLQPDCQSILADVRDPEVLRQAFASFKPQVVFHLAAQSLVRASYAQPIDTFSTNMMGTANVLEAVRSCDATKAVIVVTTDKCYENLGQGQAFVEDDALGGHDPYSASKAGAELVTASYRRSFFAPSAFGSTHHTLIASARAGNVIGGGDWAVDRLVPDIVRAITSNTAMIVRKPDATRPWQHVLDPLAGYLRLGQRLLAGSIDCATSFNFGPDQSNTLPVRAIVEQFKQQLPQLTVCYSPDQATLHEADELALDSTKARQLLGWRPIWDSTAAIDRTAQWYAAYLSDATLRTEQDFDDFTQAMGHLAQ